MQSEKFGPVLWETIHTICFNYKPSRSNKKNYKMFFNSLGEVIPCLHCKMSYKHLMAKYPVERFLRNQNTLFLWSWMLHKEVNVKLGKKTLSHERSYEKYNRMVAKKTGFQHVLGFQ